MIYLDKRILLIAILGFSSGLPLWLTSSTLAYWLTESGTSYTAIGLFALVGVPYTFKFIWSPLIDRMPLPLLASLLGRRRSWMLFSQVLLILALLAMSQLDPQHNLSWMAIFAFIIAFLSATQDIVIDAYRVDILDEKTYGAGAATIVFGYRIGMIVSGAGALYLAAFFSWSFVYQIMALCMGIGILATLLGDEPIQKDSESTQFQHNWFEKAIMAPFADFMNRSHWWLILIFITLYKLGDAFVSNMTSPFYLDLGFSKIEIANITKLFGLIASLMGSFIGGWITSRSGVLKALLICGLFQMFSNLAFVFLAYAGHDLSALMLTIAIENITGGMGTVALVAYLSSLCHVSFTATQYALLSSMTAVGRTLLSAPSGVLVEAFNWSTYFMISTVMALPGLLLLVFLMRSAKNSFDTTVQNI